MKPIAFTIADKNNEKYAKMMANSFKKFHPDIPIVMFGEEQIAKTRDMHIFYRATPYFARQLMKDGYDMVLKLDADQIILGSLDHIFNTDDYDVGTVLNINRVDPPKYGVVGVWDIKPQHYYNAGLVAMRSKAFVEHWFNLCYSEHFLNYQYREQDLLNIMTHYGTYNVRCFDIPDAGHNYVAWHGLLSKGEGMRMILKNDTVYLPKDTETKYPPERTAVKVYHFAGGQGAEKMNYRTCFNEEIIAYIDKLVSD